MNADTIILRVAVDVPVHRYFDYLPMKGASADGLRPGMRLWVPFGRRRRLALLVEIADRTDQPAERLKAAYECVDDEPVLPRDLLQLLHFAADYYQQPPGEVFWQALPAALRRGAPADAVRHGWRPTPAGMDADLGGLSRRAPRQAQALDALRNALSRHSEPQIPTGVPAFIDARKPPETAGALEPEVLARALQALLGRGFVERYTERPAPPARPWTPQADPLPLNDEQAVAAAAVREARGFSVFLLAGVTGSGKTEVYMHCIAAAQARGLQSLVLVPEIALTPQLIQRFRERFGDAVVVLHSGLADGERLTAWQAARDGSAAIVVGTRSALFAPLARPGLLILDEEHDPAYRQQEGVRYSARDLAVVRARALQIPLLLGSATPSLESLRHADQGRYRLLSLPQRAGGGTQPRWTLIDLTRHAQRDGLSTPLIGAIQKQLDEGGQILLFLNRRGFAPALWCTACGHVSTCKRCDARLTVHQGSRALRCHHCGAQPPKPERCPACQAELIPVGQGTQRIEQTLQALFPGVPVARLDRDATRRRGALEQQLADVRSGTTRILVGTQMLAKGHDFPDIGLVGVLDADGGLFASDFRASELLAQTIVQVAGRAGRAQRPGQVLIQTRFPQHPLLQTLLAEGYPGFARTLLAERLASGWPPHSRLALLHAEAAQREPVLAFLAAAAQHARQIGDHDVRCLGPAPAAMERRAGQYRHRLLFQAAEPAPLIRVLRQLTPRLAALPEARKVRWTVDVDPLELL